MSGEDLASVYSLFVDGFVVGGLLSAVPFMIGCVIRGIMRLITRNT